jgi:hypothetical protein
MTRNDQEMYSNISSIAKSLEKIAKALDNKVSNELVDATTKDIPGFEGVLNDLDNLYQPDLSVYGKKDDDNDLNEARKYANLFAKDEYETDGTSVGNGKYEDEEYDKYADDPNLEVQMNQDEPYEYDLRGIRVDSDHDIRNTAAYYEDVILSCEDKDLKTKKDAILDYVTNEFGSHGARYTDVIKFAYYLGASNAPKYDSNNRGYYAMAFAPRYGGHLIQGGKDYLVKGINKEGKERYFALSFVESATDYWKRIG